MKLKNERERNLIYKNKKLVKYKNENQRSYSTKSLINRTVKMCDVLKE